MAQKCVRHVRYKQETVEGCTWMNTYCSLTTQIGASCDVLRLSGNPAPFLPLVACMYVNAVRFSMTCHTN